MYVSSYILITIIALVGMVVQGVLKAKFEKYGKTPLRAGLSGKEVAEKMLAEHGITDVQVISTPGALTDHYNPLKKTVNLSRPVYDSRSVAAAAVAAHEVGHAVQHARGYAWLKMRSAMVPMLSVSNKFVTILLIAGILMLNSFPQLLLAGIILFALTVVFSFITLPVEYDASRRAKQWLEQTGLVTPEEKTKVADALKWAARTYVVAALSSLVTLLYYLNIYNSRR